MRISDWSSDVCSSDLLQEGASPKTSGLTAAVLALGQSLNLTVVAEGIEHHEQWMTLRDLGCELGQGFYFARPMSAEAATELLLARSGARRVGNECVRTCKNRWSPAE